MPNRNVVLIAGLKLTRTMFRFRIRLIILSLLITALVTFASYNKKESFNTFSSSNVKDLSLLVLTVANDRNINLKRLIRSADIHGIPIKVLGWRQQWKGLGHKIRFLREELKHHAQNGNEIIMFADAHDALINARADQILQKFVDMNVRVLFSADYNCVPDPALCPKYPPPETEKKYLNSGLFIGYASDIYRLLAISDFPPEGNDQLYFTQVFLNDTLRREVNFTLDYRCRIFQTVEGGPNIIDILYKGRKAYIYNQNYKTIPLVVHTPGYFKPYVNHFANFIPNAWNPVDGCTACLEHTFHLSGVLMKDFPSVLIAAFIEESTQEIDMFLHWLQKLDYPGEKIDLIFYNTIAKYTKLLDTFKQKYGAKYRSVSVKYIDRGSSKNYRNSALDECVKKKCDYYLNLDSIVHLNNPHSLRLLVEQNRTVVAPLLFGPDKKSNNFLAYLEPDYLIPAFTNATLNKRRGLWSVLAVSNCYLVQGHVVRTPEAARPSYSHPDHRDPDMAFSLNLKKIEIELFLTNRADFGYLVNPGKMGTCTIFSCGSL